MAPDYKCSFCYPRDRLEGEKGVQWWEAGREAGRMDQGKVGANWTQEVANSGGVAGSAE